MQPLKTKPNTKAKTKQNKKTCTCHMFWSDQADSDLINIMAANFKWTFGASTYDSISSLSQLFHIFLLWVELHPPKKDMLKS